MSDGYHPANQGNPNVPPPDSQYNEDSTRSWRNRVGLRSLLRSRSASPPLASPEKSTGHSTIRLIEDQLKRGSPVTPATFPAIWDAVVNKNGVGLDDRKFLLEEVLVFMSNLSPGSQLATQVEHFMIDFLYKDLPHPPSTYLSSMVASIPSTVSTIPKDPKDPKAPIPVVGLKGFAWREADGSNNNPLLPHLGAAHTPYARSVASSHPTPSSVLPDPALVFDTLLRRSAPLDHPTGLSSMFFAFANLIIHSLFRTSRLDWSVNDTSSYLDLSPLYGVDEVEQMGGKPKDGGPEVGGVRAFDGKGKLYEDVWADRRLLGMPPATAALLVVFNRNHNFVATRIFDLNENKKYVDPKELDKDTLRAQDDEIFNRARLVNCGAFMQVIMRDYVGSILRMIPDLKSWHLRPLDPMRDSAHSITPRGEGNVCSVEFNLLYRWHATTSTKDEKWLNDMFKRALPDKSYDEITEREFVMAAAKQIYQQGPDPRKWKLGTLQRDESGRFKDADLAAILQGASADAAQAFRARGIPAAFKVIEVMGIEQARSWGVCSLNEFRKFLGLKPYTSFEEWNGNIEISSVAKQLYKDIDNMELYVGMQAEDTRPSRPGSGLCSGYTMSRSILADAVALIRGDRFLTTEYTPYNLTSWGFQDVQTTDDNGSLGGMLTKLLFRTLPQHYTPSSISAHFPFILKSAMHNNMKNDREMMEKYIWSEPPSALPPIVPVQGLRAVEDVVKKENEKVFVPPYGERMVELTKRREYGFYFGSIESLRHKRAKAAIYDILFTPEANARHAQYYFETTRELILDKAYSPVGVTTRTVDIVREVINCVPLHWITTHVVQLPLATKENPNGKYSEQELYSYLALLFTYVYFNSEPVNAWFLKHHSHKAAKVLLDVIKAKVNEANSLVSTVREKVGGVVGKFTSGFLGSPHDDDARRHALHQLLQNKKNELDDESSADVADDVFGIVINSVANWSHAMTHVVNFYLDPARKGDKDAIVALAVRPASEETESLLIGYVVEALRLDPPVAGVVRDVASKTLVQEVSVDRDWKVFANLRSALVDEKYTGPDATFVNPRRRDVANHLSFVPGAHSSLNQEFSHKTMAHVMRAVFSKKNIRRGPGSSGQLARFTEKFHGTDQTLYIDGKGQTTQWPQSLIVQFDI